MWLKKIKRTFRKLRKKEQDVRQKITLGPILCKIRDAKYGDEYSVIAHGGGGTQSNGASALLYTNLLASIMDSIEDGKKLIEVDLAITSDNKIVGVHSWPEIKSLMAYEGIKRKVQHDNTPLSYDEVRSFEFESGVKPIDIKEINGIFFDYKDLILVVDKIDDLTLLVTEFNYPDRMIVEVFNVDSFDLAVSLGIKNIVFNINIKDKHVSDWVIRNKIPAVTFSAHSLDSNLRAYENAVKMKESGVVSLAYSSNDDLFLKNNIGITVSAVYTDYWSLKNRATNILGGRTTY